MRWLPSLVVLVFAASPAAGQPADYLDKIGTRNLDAVKPVGFFPTIIPRANSPRATLAPFENRAGCPTKATYSPPT